MDNSPSGLAPRSDQHFLSYFITGIYFAPDLKGENHKPVLQRWGEGRPPYTKNQLAGSWMDVQKIEKVYYYVLRKADKSVILKSSILHQFFQGSLPIPTGDHNISFYQFDDLFPPKLHHLVTFKNHCEMVRNIVFIHNPDLSSIKPEDIERFKKLTGLLDFCLDRNEAMSHLFSGDDILPNVSMPMPMPVPVPVPMPMPEKTKSEDIVYHRSKRSSSSAAYGGESPGGCRELVPHPFGSLTPCGTSGISYATVTSPTITSSGGYRDQRMIFLPSPPSREVWSKIVAATENGVALTGTAACATVGRSVGLVNIAESDDSYLFQVSLPGVKRSEREFSCEVEKSGKVLVAGATTAGETTVRRFSLEFQMQSQNLCPSGPFSMSFHLPGPVEPEHFSGIFGTDGILEGLVKKANS